MKVITINGNDLVKLDLGCSNKKRDGYLGLDICPHDCVDIVADLSKDGIPLGNKTIDELYTSHCLEHIPQNEIPFVWHEVHRACKTGAKVIFRLPYYANAKALTLISHITLFSERTFMASKFFCNRFDIKKIKFNYVPEWQDKPSAEQEFARIHYMNVVFDFEVICINKEFIPWKQAERKFAPREFISIQKHIK